MISAAVVKTHILNAILLHQKMIKCKVNHYEMYEGKEIDAFNRKIATVVV